MLSNRNSNRPNLDPETVKGFGREWSTFTQERLSELERSEIFKKYFSLIDWGRKPQKALDMGCGSGRWDVLVAAKVNELVVADASREALRVAMRNVHATNVHFIQCTPDTVPYADGYFDLIFSLGVLHHVPDTQAAVCSLARKLRSGGTLLLYLYYAFDNRPWWYQKIWQFSDFGRRFVSSLPFPLRYGFSQAIAFCVYWPLARTAKHVSVSNSWPLKFYADRSFYVMRTDALDRLGTKLEKRFNRKEIIEMLEAAGLVNIRFSDSEPYWVCTAVAPSDERK